MCVCEPNYLSLIFNASPMAVAKFHFSFLTSPHLDLDHQEAGTTECASKNDRHGQILAKQSVDNFKSSTNAYRLFFAA
jgi:hypothetical protein